MLLEGDNYIWLKILEQTHKGKIDVIYIDPPYNTGNNDFVYDDRFVNESDGFSHSKWLSFMSERLTIARNLLAQNGIIFISIDDHEQAELKMLCDSIFGADNFYGEMIQLKGNTQNDAKSIQRNHEYILCYARTYADRLLTYKNTTLKPVYEDSWVKGRNPAASSGHDLLSERTNLGYTIYYYEGAGNGKTGNHNLLSERTNLGYTDWDVHESKNGDTIQLAIAVMDYDKDKVTDGASESDVYADVDELLALGFRKIRPPKRKGGALGRWTWGLETFKQYWNNNEVVIKGDEIIRKVFVPQDAIIEKNGKKYYPNENRLPLQSVIQINNSEGTKQLRGDDGLIPGVSFPYPKNVELIKYLVMAYDKRDAVILDFFAGSGTTAQAVEELNIEDGGNRQWIVCTDNANDICRSITKPRIDTFITGTRTDGSKYSDGIDSSYAYFQYKMLSRTSNAARNSRSLLVPRIVDAWLMMLHGVRRVRTDEARKAFIYEGDDVAVAALFGDPTVDDVEFVLSDADASRRAAYVPDGSSALLSDSPDGIDVMGLSALVTSAYLS